MRKFFYERRTLYGVRRRRKKQAISPQELVIILLIVAFLSGSLMGMLFGDEVERWEERAKNKKDITAVALSQEGNVGGMPYWTWYGFDSRVEWCACFVSWCANQCGYIDSKKVPKFSVVDDGMNWFIKRGKWLDKSNTPKTGMIIFFDWSADGLDGKPDHVGIVERVTNGRVCTVEGNRGNECKRMSYSLNSKEILGYGYP